MSIIFSIITTISLILLTIFNPNLILESVSTATNKALTLTVNLFSIYIFWLGVNEILKSIKFDRFLSKILKPVLSPLFKVKDEETLTRLSNGLSFNMLGLGGIATIENIECMKKLEEQNNHKAQTLLLTISSTSVQILPISVMSLLSELGMTNSYIIILPTLICTIFSTVLGIVLCKVFS